MQVQVTLNMAVRVEAATATAGVGVQLSACTMPGTDRAAVAVQVSGSQAST